MAKRGATSELNHDNWDDDCEGEEAGIFKQASEDVILKRKIKVAKRRSNVSTESGTSSPFANFSGFKAQTTGNKSIFNLTPTTNGGDEKAKVSNIFNIPSNTNISNSSQNTEKESSSSEEQYVANLTSLNKKVSEWIKLHVDKNPLCILSPVFNDYERYLKEIREKRDAKSDKNEVKSPFVNFKAVQEEEGTAKEVVSKEKNKNESALLFSGFKSTSPSQSVLLKKPDPASLMVNPFTSKLSSTGNKTVESGNSQPTAFSFSGSSQPFTFSNVSAPTSSHDKEEQVEESDEPLKVEFKPVQEKDSQFSIRCKVFVKKDSNYADHGVGTLYVKKVTNEKYQLLVRADTVLGNILVNVLLSSSIPMKRMGNNNVMLVCLPTPETAPPPTTVLLRVKTPEEADDLIKTLERYKS